MSNLEENSLPNLRDRMLVGGEWLDAKNGDVIAVFDPATGDVIAHVPDADTCDVDHAVETALKTFQSTSWRGMAPAARERILLRLADLIEANGEELAVLETRNNGKLLAYSRMFEVGASAQWLRYMAGWATKISGTTLDLSIPLPPAMRTTAYTRRVPIGVVGSIIPWNFPLLMAIWKIAPALACGNTVVLKPAEETPLTALRLGELALEAGLPGGALNVITGRGERAGAALVAHPKVNKIAFTGSTEVGRLIGAICGQNLKPASLELGGKSPVIVLDDCDPAVAAQGAADAIFFNHGQVCTAGSRLYVHREIYDEVVQRLAAIADNMVVGSGFDAAVHMGPLVSKRHRERVQTLIDSGLSDGAERLCGAGSLPDKGFFVRPTVFANPDNRPMKLLREEVFGPVLVAMPFADIAEVINEANGSVYGLGASVWTNRLDAAMKLAECLEAGTVWVNTHNMVDPNLPFGGFKESGIGREHGAAAVESYTTTKAVCIAYSS